MQDVMWGWLVTTLVCLIIFTKLFNCEVTWGGGRGGGNRCTDILAEATFFEYTSACFNNRLYIKSGRV